MSSLDRRDFIKTSAVTLASMSALSAARAADKPNDKIVMAIAGVKSRGLGHVSGFSAFDDVEIAYLCDVDENVIPNALKRVNPKQTRAVKVEKDIRKILEDKEVNAISIATPDHWHALMTIWGCQAGKDVYVEKPISHNLVEGRRMIEAARKYDRIVDVGTQRRSGAHILSAAEFVRSGKLGKVPFVKTWIAGNRKTIGHKSDGAVPAGVDYNLWLGAAPERPFNPNRFHYEWHWNWDYGTGELGNNGIHYMDVARIIVPGLDDPLRITSTGGIFYYDDDRQTPDTQIASFDFAHTNLTWEHRIWSKTGAEGQASGIIIYGEKGTLVFDKDGWHVTDGVEGSGKNAEIEKPHLRNFVDCVKSRKKPNADIEEGHKSTRLCHLGNIAYRLGRTLRFDAATETILEDPAANKLLGREYRKPFVMPEKV